MTSSNIEVADVSVTHEVIDSKVQEVTVGEAGPTSVEVQTVGASGPPGPVGPTGPVGPQGVSGIVTVTHGAFATLARPNAPVVYWIGSVLPNNAIATDLWYQT